MATLQQDIQVMLGERKADVREEMRERVWRVQRISDRLQLSMAEARANIETVKVVTMRNGFILIFAAGVVVMMFGYASHESQSN